MSSIFDSIARSPTRSTELTSRDNDIFDAIEKKDLNSVKKFIQSGKTKLDDTHPSDIGVYEQYTPLAFACSVGALDIVQFLIQKGADPNRSIRQKIDVIYPIHVACKFGHVSILQLLEKYNTRMFVRNDFDKETPMFFAVKSKHWEVVEKLLELGVRDLDYNDRCIHVTCELICEKNKNEKDINSLKKIISLLLRYHDINNHDYVNCRTLRTKVAGESERNRLANDKRANRTPLLILTELNADKEVVSLFMKADMNIQHNIHKKTALHWACQHNNEQVVRFLLLNGANKYALDSEGKLPTAYSSSQSIVKEVEQFSRFDTILESVKRQEMIRRIDEILQKGNIQTEYERESFIISLEYMKAFKIDQIEKQLSNLQSNQVESLESELKAFFLEYLVIAAQCENKDAMQVIIKRYDVDINQLTKRRIRKNDIIDHARYCFLQRREKTMIISYRDNQNKDKSYKFMFTSSTTEFDLRLFINNNVIKGRVLTMRELRFKYILNGKELYATTTDLFKQMINDAYESNEDPFNVSMEYVMEDWTRLGELGKGQYGVVYLCLDHNDKSLFALKEISTEKIKRELEAYKKDTIMHENIIQYFGYKEGNGKYFVKLQYMPGGNLFDLVDHLKIKKGSLSISRIALYTRQLLLAVKHLHERGIYHCDIKPHNILIENQDCIKLSDFGESNEGTVTSAAFGTTCYLPGDIFKVKPITIDYSIDIWSVGVTLFQLLLGGENPYNLIPGVKQRMDSSTYKANTMILVVTENWEKLKDVIPSWCDSSLKEFLRKCLKSKNRPTAEKLLSHSFLKRNRTSTPNVTGLKNEDSQETNIILQYLNERQNGATIAQIQAPKLAECFQPALTTDDVMISISDLDFVKTNDEIPQILSPPKNVNYPVTPNRNMVGLNLNDFHAIVDDTASSTSPFITGSPKDWPGELDE